MFAIREIKTGNMMTTDQCGDYNLLGILGKNVYLTDEYVKANFIANTNTEFYQNDYVGELEIIELI